MYKAPSGLAPVVLIPGLGYEAVVRLRNWAYSSNRLRQRKLESPVISIGNLTMGGTGKTPLVIYIAQMLLKLGSTPAVLSRGYGRLSSEMQIASPGMEIDDPTSTLGDEPALIRRRVPNAWMGISKNRFEAGIRLEQHNKMTFLLDDGFQHRKLFRDLDIAVIDGSQPLEANRVFPRGSLREPLSALHRCNIIMIHGAPDEIAQVKTTIKNIGVQAEVLTYEQKITAVIPFADWQKSINGAALSTVKTAYPVAALGNPERFLNDLTKIGVVWREKKFFPDHHKLSRQDWMGCCEEARRNAADVIILTEKDAIKISDPPDFPLAVAVQSTEMSDSGALENILRKVLRQ
jgi:tetraacyldisaccharide 4'-kinase